MMGPGDVRTYARALVLLQSRLAVAEQAGQQDAVAAVRRFTDSYPYNDPAVIEAAKARAQEQGLPSWTD